MKKFKSYLFLSLFSFALIIPFFAPDSVNAQSAGIDENAISCTGLGLDLDRRDASGLAPMTGNDFIITVIDRGTLLVQPTDPNKRFFGSSGVPRPTYGEIFGDGCIITDSTQDSGFDYQFPEDSLVSTYDLSSASGGFGSQVDNVGNDLGLIDTNNVTMRLWFAVRYQGSGGFFDADNDFLWFDEEMNSWDNGSGIGSVRNVATGVLIPSSNIRNPENFNISLIISGSPGSLVLTTTGNGNVRFSQASPDSGPFAGRVIFVRNPANINDGFIALPSGTTAEALMSASGWVPAQYYDDEDATGLDIQILGGVGQEAARGTIPDSVNVGNIDQAPTCELAADFAFGFVICPLLSITDKAISWLDNRIISSLNVDSAYYENEDIREAWGNVRNIAYILLIPVALMMVIGTALQLSFVDAYTVKRALPRLFVAIIFIALSYDVAAIMIEIVNNVGRGVAGIITSPFGGLDQLTLTAIFANGDSTDTALFTGGVLAGIGIAFLSGVTIWTLFSFIGVAALALLIIFVLLSVRELMIVFLLVVSPIAIITWIFPGNDKLWKLWWGTFSKMLLIYPIIMAFLGMGRAFATIVGEAGGDAVVSTIVKLVAFIGPYFFIPKAFQMAGGAFANLAGMANDRGKGLFDRQRKFRAKNMENKREKLEKRGLVRPTGALGRTNFGKRLNERGAQGYALKNAAQRDGLRGLTRTGMNDSLDRKRIHEEGAAAKDEVLDRKGKNDNFLHMLEMVMNGESDEAMMQYLGNNGYNPGSARLAIAQGKNMYDEYGHGLGKIISDGKAASKTSQTADFAEHLRNIWALSHGDEGMMMELIGSGSAAFNQAGRLEMSGGSYGEKAAMAKAFANVGPDGRYNGPATVDYFDEVSGENQRIDFSEAMGPNATMTVQDVINRRQRQKARDSFGTWDWSRIHPSSVKSVMSDIHSSITETSTQLRDPNLTGQERYKKERLLGQQLAQLQSLRQNAMQSGNDEVQRIVADAYDGGTPIDTNLGGSQFQTITQILEDTQGRASGTGVTRVTGEYVPAAQLAEIPAGVLEGYRSVSKTGNMSPEQMEQLRQANTPS